MRILLTGGAGFIGHHILEHFLKNTDYKIVLLDRLDCSSNLGRVRQIESFDTEKSRIDFFYHDLKSPVTKQLFSQIGQVDWVLHLGASTHVDRSIEYPMEFVMDNVVGTTNTLEYAKNRGAKMLYFSTDEVFGPAPVGVLYKEWDRYNSGNPYSASKAGGEEMCLAYQNTYKLPVMISHCMNVFGERQHPEKFIPNTISKVLNGETVLIHSDRTRTHPGTRFYIHARNVAQAVEFIMEKGVSGEKYNIVGELEVDNLQLAKLIAKYVDKPLKYELVSWHESRPGHDLRYGLCGEKMKSLGWMPATSFEASLEKTINWTLNHKEWLKC
jgi:dTDP-glucose 4,6-dehydratase